MNKKTENTKKKNSSLALRKRMKYGSVAMVITVIFIAIVVLINVIVTMVVNKNPSLTLDLTSSNVYSVSDDTVDYIKNLDQDVDIAISADESTFDTGNKYYKMIQETINKYQSYSDHITITYFDPTDDPDILAQYQDIYSGDITSNEIIVASGDRCKVYGFMDMFEIDEDQYQYYQYGYASLEDCLTAFKGEQVLTTAIMNVTDSNAKTVGVIDKLNDNYIYSQTQANYYAVEQTKSLLDENGYDVTSLDLGTDELDTETYDILLLPAPVSDLTTDALTKISDFLYNDGALNKQLIYIADCSQGNTPNLDAFLKEWNISVDSSYVQDGSTGSQTVSTVRGSGSVPVVSVNADEDDKGYDGNLENTSLPIVAPLARPITSLTVNNDRLVVELLTTSDTSYAHPLTLTTSDSSIDDISAEDATEEATTEEATTTTTFDDTSVEHQSYSVMTLCRDQQVENNTYKESDVLVIGSMSMLDYYVLQDSSYNNAEYFIGVLNSICGKEDSIVIASKDMSITSISVSDTQLKLFKYLVVFGIPVVVAAIGIVVTVRRRYR